MENQITNNYISEKEEFPKPIGVRITSISQPIGDIKIGDVFLSHDKLLSGLYFILDAFERSGLQFFLIRQTAKDAMKDIFNPLKGDHLDIGVRLNEWANDQKDILFPYFAQEHVEIIKKEPMFLDCVWQDIPFTIHLYEDNPCITALIPVAYQYESWNVPNMFERFEKEYDC